MVEFMHKVGGNWYSNQVKSLSQLVAVCREVYGDLRGVEFAELGKDFDRVQNIGRMQYPVKNGHLPHARPDC